MEEKEFDDDAAKEKCATPTIAYVGGRLTFATATEGADCVWGITSIGGNSGRDTAIEVPSVFELTVYATKDGWKNSDRATALLVWGDDDVEGDNVIRIGGQGGAGSCDVNGDGKVDVSDYIGVANYILTGSIYGSNVSRVTKDATDE
jgi:hypothetical protein